MEKKDNSEEHFKVAPKQRYLPATPLKAQVKEEHKSASYPPSWVSDIEQPSDNAMCTLTKLTEMLAQGLQAAHYKKLKLFSGNVPVPPGEEGFEVWKEHTLQCLREWSCSEEAKRQRVTESLRSPAAEIVRLYRDTEEGANAADYIQVLSDHFKPYYDLEQMVADYRMSRQKEGENVSAFITRLQLLLSRLVYHQAIRPYEVDSMRTSQLVRGLLPHHPLAQLLKMMLSDKVFPIHELMRIVKKQEADVQFSTPTKVKSVTKDFPSSPTQSEQLGPYRPKPPVTRPVVSQREGDPRKCFRCGQIGHSARHCHEEYGGTVQSVAFPVQKQRRKHLKRKQRRPLIGSKSVVGSKSIVKVTVNGHTTPALFDTGSQVTLIYRSFYQKYLSMMPLQSTGQMELWGLNADSYPVDGSLQVIMTVPGLEDKGVLPMEITALVCPDTGDVRAAPVILGTNCKAVHNAFQKFLEGNWTVSSESSNIPGALKEFCDVLAVGYQHGVVYHIGEYPVEIPPGGERVLRVASSIAPDLLGDGSYVLIETPEEMITKRGWMVIPERKDWRARVQSSSVVTVRNCSPHSVVIGPRQGVAHCCPVLGVNPYAEVCRVQVRNAAPNFKLDLADPNLPEAWTKKLTRRLSDLPEVFSTDDMDVGCARSAQHNFRLSDTTPFRERPRRIPPKDVDELRHTLNQMKDQGIIVDSKSPYASPIVVVRKKCGSIRLCVDYRTLNRRTIPDQYTLPRIEEALEALNGNCWFTVLDLRSGYYQVPMAPEDQEKTAFICPLGFYQFTRMPQGIRGAPATFQRLMERVLGDLVPRECLVYLDDIIVFGATLEEHEERLMRVLQRLKEEGLKLSADKCKFCRSSVTYVGHIVSAEGVATDPAKVETVVNWPQPKNITELRSFLGFCGYYRRFVEGYSKVAKSLHDLLKSDINSPEKQKRSSKSPFGDSWTPACGEAFNHLKRKLTEAPVLAYADSLKPYVLHVDASFEGLGGVLHQEYPAGLRPIAFISRSLTPSERNYPVHKLEFLALKWAIVDKLHDYLYGASFEVRTDNNPLTYLQTTAKLDATGHRWLAALSNYQFTLKYKPGRKNIGADALSRRPGLPLAPEEKEWEEIPGPGVRALCAMAAVVEDKVAFSEMRLIDCMGSDPGAVPKMFTYPAALGSFEKCSIPPQRMINSQKTDPLIGPLYQAVSAKDPDMLRKSLPNECGQFLRDWEKFEIDKGLLHRVVHYHDHPGRRQLVLPYCFRKMAFRSLHDHHGHLGPEKTYGLIQDRFYWPKMRDTVSNLCRRCLRCLQRKVLPVRAAPMAHLQSSGPMDLVCIDFLCIDPDSSGIGNVLVVTDHFTRYAQAFPTKDQRAVTVAKVLWEKYFIHYGLPHRLHSDQGRDFESKLIRELLQLLNIHKSRTTPYHPEGDALPERFNRTLLDMLGTLQAEDKRTWSRRVEALVHAYNSTRHESTGFSPYFLMFGREPRLPIDLLLGVSTDGVSHQSHYQYVARLKDTLRSAYRLAEENVAKINEGNKRRFDLRVRYRDLNIGDGVLLRNLGATGKHKLADRWRKEIFTVVDKLPGIPVYKIKGPEGRVKAWHRNHLLPIPQVSDEEDTDATPESDLPQTNTPSDLVNTTDSDWTVVPDAASPEAPPPREVLDPRSPEFVPQSVSTLNQESQCNTQPVPSLPSIHSPNSGPDNMALPQREVRKGERVRHPPSILSYDNLGDPSIITQPHLYHAWVGAVSNLVNMLPVFASPGVYY